MSLCADVILCEGYNTRMLQIYMIVQQIQFGLNLLFLHFVSSTCLMYHTNVQIHIFSLTFSPLKKILSNPFNDLNKKYYLYYWFHPVYNGALCVSICCICPHWGDWNFYVVNSRTLALAGHFSTDMVIRSFWDSLSSKCKLMKQSLPNISPRR